MMTSETTAHRPSEQPRTQHIHAAVGEAPTELEALDQQVRDLIRERPVLAVFAAVVVGYVVARIASRH